CRAWFTRMIDTTKKCIVILNDVDLSKINFAILSYVWGKDQKLKLLRSNRDELEEFESLTTNVPSKTIVDAINLAKELQLPYIWVDALCILQDDDKDKAIQVGAMGLLYNTANVTIVAAAGEDADAGLPGLRPNTRFAEQQEVFVVPPSRDTTSLGCTTKGISLMTTLGPYASSDFESHNLTNTKWGSRGWTMQEQYVSRRNLIFTDEQVWWSCSCATWCEEAYFDLKEVPRFQFRGARQLDSGLLELLSSTELHLGLRQALWDAYRRIVTDYTRRSFSYDGDVYDAFSAILKAFRSLAGQTFLWGLPRSRFEAALRWERMDIHHRRIAYSTLPMGPHKLRLPFPSWSWMGWIGQAEVAVSEEDAVLLAQWPEIVCYVLRTVPFRIERIENQFNDQKQHSEVLPEPGTPLRAQWKPTSNLDVSENQLLKHYAYFADESYAHLDEGVLFFWASCAEFRVELDISTGPPHWYMILSSDGQVVGKCERDFEASKMTSQQLEQHILDKTVSSQFIVLGSRSFDPSNILLDVMQIGWRGGLAHRIDVGYISEEAWVNEKPVWSLIALG
ncbi:HET-domain-containing protein, partial [Glonium stellatum]